MTGEKRTLIKRIILTIVIFLPACVSFVVLFELISLRKELDGFKEEVRTLCYAEKHETTESISGDFLEVPLSDNSEEILQAKAEALENQQINDNIASELAPWNSKSGIRKVYLTFDDGPSNNTEQILDILDAYGVKATFFVVGKDGYTKEYQRIVDDGHTLAMHSYSHRYQEIYDSKEAYIKDLDKIHSFLYEVTGMDCKIVRFPGGSSNTISKVNMEDLVEYLSKEGIRYYDWNVSGGDATGAYCDADTIVENVLQEAEKYNNVVVLLHDSSSKISTVEALPIIIEKLLESENTVLLPISEDTDPVIHRLK